jgi:hypothetical protein
MNWHDSEHDPLDDLLQKADWPEAQPEQLDRLQTSWRRTVRRRKVRRVATAAAVILIPMVCVIDVSLIQQSPRPRNRHVVENPKQTPPVIVEHQPKSNNAPSVVAVPLDRPTLPSQEVCEPNAYERALAQLHRKQIAKAKVAAQQAPAPSPTVDIVAAAIERLTIDSKLSPLVVAQDLAFRIPNAEARLRRWFQAASSNRGETATSRQAALRILAVLATQESAPLLLAALRRSDCPTEVVQAVARLSTPEQLVARVRLETSAEWRQLWLVALFERGTSQAVGEYLNLVNAPSTSAIALAAVKKANSVPIEELFATMQHPRVPMRSAAARVLGTLSDPAISKRLAELAMNPATRREALIGLMCSSDVVAKQFLVYAQHDLSLSASVRAINKYASTQSVN